MSFLNILQLLQVILAIYVLMLVFKKGALNSQFHVALVCLVVSILVIPPFGRNFINDATMKSKEGYSTLGEAYGDREDRRDGREDRREDRIADREERREVREERREERREDRIADREERREVREERREERREDRIADREDHRDGRDDRCDDRRDGRHHHHRHDHHHHRDDHHHHRHDHDQTHRGTIQPIFPTPNHKLTPSPYTPTPTPPAPTPTPPAPKPTPLGSKPTPLGSKPTPLGSKPANVVPGNNNNLSQPKSIQMWMNNSVVYIIGKGTPGATLELSLSKSPFQNILPSDVKVNSSGEIDYSINGNTDTTLFNNIVTELNETTVYFRLSYKGQTSPIISWNDFNFGYCYFNNPAQNNATDSKSFQTTLKAANEYCVNQLDWSATNNGLPTSWP